MPAIAKNIPKEQLDHLYLQKRLSSDAIAKIFNCNHVTILNYLIKYGIPRRSRLGNRKPVKISKLELFNLYHKQKMTQKQIAGKFGHSQYGIQRWMKLYGIASKTFYESHAVHPKKDFDGKLAEKAYIIGFRLGDLNVYKIRTLVQVRCSTTKETQIELIEKLFERYGKVHIWKAKRGTHEIVALLNSSFDFLLPKKDQIEDWIIIRNEYFLSFLAGYADAEGSYYLKKPNIHNGKVKSSVFEIQSYDKYILTKTHNVLTSLGVEAYFGMSRRGGYIDKRGVKTNKDCWRIVIIKKQALWNFIKLIEPYHRHSDKIRNLRLVKDNLVRKNSLPYCKPITL